MFERSRCLMIRRTNEAVKPFFRNNIKDGTSHSGMVSSRLSAQKFLWQVLK